MSDLETRLWQQLEAAAEREARRPRIRMPAAPRRPLALALVIPAILFALAIVALAGTLRRTPSPAHRAPPPIQRLHLSSSLDALAAGDGGVWVHDPDRSLLLRVDPVRRRVTARIAVHGPWTEASVATGAGGPWVASVRRANHAAIPPTRPELLLRVDPRSDRVVARIPLRAPGGAPIGPSSLMTRGGSVWVWGPTGAVEVDPRTNRAVLGVPVPGGDARGFDAAGGSVWLATDVGQLERFDARTGARTARLPIHPHDPQRAVIALRDIVVLDGQDGTMLGLDPATGRHVWSTRVGTAVRATHLAGAVLWVTAEDPNGGGDRLLSLDPQSGRIGARIALPSDRTQAIAVVGHEVWVTTATGDVLVVRP